MQDHKRIYRIFQTIARLRGELGIDKARLAKEFNVTERTIERYIALLKDIGFIIEKRHERYYIPSHSKTTNKFDDLIAFSIEEAATIRDAMVEVSPSGPLKHSIMDKLYWLTEMEAIGTEIQNLSISRNIAEVRKAIQLKKQVWLKDYESSNSGTTQNRLVEPIRFFDYYNHLLAFEVSSNMVKQFKTKRIGGVTITDTDWKFESRHKKTTIDLFGMNGKTSFEVELLLGLRAKQLIIEEFSGANNYIKAIDGKFMFKAKVTSLEGVGRFVMGLLDDIEVIAPKALKELISEKIKKFSSRHYLSER